MYNVFLVDDSKINNKVLEKLLMRYTMINNIYPFNDPFKALEKFESLRPELVFLDIEMPGLNGLKLAGILLEMDPKLKIVFVSAYDLYAINAFELNAVDYILKPINFERLHKTIQRIEAIKEYEAERNQNQLTITTFGKLQVYKDHTHVRWQGGKVEELFAFLISHYGYYVHKDVIIDTLWENYNYKRALGNMHTTVYRARQSLNDLGNFCAIDYSSNNYRLQMNNVCVDLLDFYFATRITEITKDNLLSVVKGLEVYKKPFLEENGYLWAYAKQITLERDFLTALNRISNYLQGENMYSEALTLLNSLKSNYLFDSSIRPIFNWTK